MDFRVPENSQEEKSSFSLIQRTFAYTSTAIVSFFVLGLLGVVAFFIDRHTNSTALSVGILIIGFDFVLSSLSLSVWSFGKYLKKSMKRFWERSIPPHNLPKDSISISHATGHVFSKQIFVDTGKETRLEFDDPRRSFYVSVAQFLFGVILVLIGVVIVTVVDSSGVLSEGIFADETVSVNNTVSMFSAFLSVLLGPIVGVVMLGIVSISAYPPDVIFFFLLLVFPSLLFVPSSKNLSVSTRNLYKKLLSEYNIGSYRVEPLSILFLVVYLLMVVALISMLLGN